MTFVPPTTDPPPERGWLWYVRVLVWLRYLVVPAWIAGVAAAAILLPAPGGGSLPLGGLVVSDSPAQTAAEREAQLFRVPLVADTVVVQRNPEGLSLGTQRRVVDAALATSGNQEPGSEVLFALPVSNSLRLLPGSRENGTATVTYLFFERWASLRHRTALGEQFAAEARKIDPNAFVGVTGPAPARYEAFGVIQDRLTIVEIATVLAIGLVVGFAFRSIGAPLLILGAAGGAYVVASRLTAALGEARETAVPEEVQPVIVALTLGLITDYGVFYLAAARRRLLEDDSRAGIVASAARITPVIVAAGFIVAAGTIVLVVAELELFRVIGGVLAVTALVAMATAVTVVPAAIAIFGRTLFRPGLRREARAIEHVSPLREAATRFVVSRPVSLVILLVCVTALVVASARSADLALGFRTIEGLPSNSEPKRAADEASLAFAPGILAPTVLILDSPGVRSEGAALLRMERALSEHPGVAGVVGPADVPDEFTLDAFVSPDGNAARYALILEDEPLGAPAIRTLRSLKERLPAMVEGTGLATASASVTGQTAIAAETVDSIRASIPFVALAALLVNFLFLAIFLRALVAPLYLLAASVLSVTATIGLTAFFFMGILGQDDVTYYVPFAAGVLLLALGSDYNVFLVGRIWQQARTMRLREAIGVAAPRASKAITIAGVALALSFGALAIVPLGTMREFAFFMSAGVLIETFVVRPLVVPALLSLFGRVSAWPGEIRRVEPEEVRGG